MAIHQSFGPRTPWSMILAMRTGSSEDRNAVLDHLVTHYREPVLRFIQYRLDTGTDEPGDDADDLTQAFFIHFLENNRLDELDPERGSFRAYIKKLLVHFVIDEQRKKARNRPDAVLTKMGTPNIPEAGRHEERPENRPA